MARKGGYRRKHVKLLTKPLRSRGKVSQTRYLAGFNVGDKVSLNLEPAIHKGMFHPRFSGKIATVVEKKGSCYEVKIKDFAKEKLLIVHPIHLRKMRGC